MQKVFVVRGGSEIKEGLYSEEEFALLSRRLAGERGNDLHSLPSVLIRSGESEPEDGPQARSGLGKILERWKLDGESGSRWA